MHGARNPRTAFSMIELLVVIAIIAILMALVSAAVVRTLVLGPEAGSRNDLSQLGVSLSSMQTAFSLRSPPPSLLFLSNNRNDYTNTSLPYPNLRRDSLTYLGKMFPRADWSTVTWSVGGVVVPNGGVILEGDQCLVFFLGGPDGTNGFSTDPSNPMAATATRKGPYYEFPLGRLKAMPALNVAMGRSQSALSFLDYFNKAPYLYFSSGSRKNGYNAYASEYGSDCKTALVSPYYPPAATKRYFNIDTFQLICAGENSEFGPGGAYDSASPDPGLLQKGTDDLTNFHGSRLLVAE